MIAVCSATFARAGQRVGDVDVSVLPVPSKDATQNSGPRGVRHGYVEYRVQLKNFSDKDQLVRLSSETHGNKRAYQSEDVHLAAKQEVLVSIALPPIDAEFLRL